MSTDTAQVRRFFLALQPNSKTKTDKASYRRALSLQGPKTCTEMHNWLAVDSDSESWRKIGVCLSCLVWRPWKAIVLPQRRG